MIDSFIDELNKLSKDIELEEVYIPYKMYCELGARIASGQYMGWFLKMHTSYSIITIYYHHTNEVLYTENKLTKQQLLKIKFDKNFNNKLENILND